MINPGMETITLAATMTTVTITLTDSDGVLWANARVLVTFVAPPNTQGPYLWNGVAITTNYVFNDVGTSGQLSLPLPGNLDIIPNGERSLWRFTIAPNADDARSVNFSVLVVGASMDLSSTFSAATAAVPGNLVQSIPIPRAANDSEVILTPNEGQMYFNTTVQAIKVWSNGQWVQGGGGASYPPAGIPVSTGLMWSASIDPATLATVSQLPQVIQVADETTAINSSVANPTNFYFWTV